MAGWGSLVLALALGLGAWLARRVTAPLETLAQRVTAAEPAQLPAAVAQGLGDDEVAAVGRAFDALLERTREFVAREQAFTRDASHELRTPLAVLRLQIERLQADPATPAAVHQGLAAMQAATLLMQQTVETLLLMAREPAAAGAADAAPTPPVAVLPLAEHWVLAHDEWLRRQPLRLALALRRDDAIALPAPVLQLVLASLLGNAFAHGQPGGAVRVALEGGALVVSNPGAAPPADATEPHTRGEGSRGHGLGLAILQRLLQRHGAQLRLAHADGVTSVSVALASGPVSAPPASSSSTGSPPSLPT
jgi:signal transduction histidine kinase